MSQPPPEANKSKLPLIILAVVVVAIIVVVAIFVLGGDDDEGGGSAIDAAGANRGLETLIRDGSFDDAGVQDLRNCPMGDLDSLMVVVGGVVELDDDVLEGDAEATLNEEGDYPAFVDCYTVDVSGVRNGPTQVYYQGLLDPPRDYEQYITDFYVDDNTSVEFEDTVEYQGGEVFLFCFEAETDEGIAGCDADWVNTDEDIALSIFFGGEDQSTEDAFTALKAVLPTMARNLAAEAAEES